MIPVPGTDAGAHTEALQSNEDAQQGNFKNQPFSFRLFRAAPTRCAPGRSAGAAQRSAYRARTGRDRKALRYIGAWKITVHSQFGDDAAHFARQEWLFDHRTAALGDELAQGGSERIAGHEDDPHAASRPAPLDLLVERAAVEIRHADIRKDHIVVFDGH